MITGEQIREARRLKNWSVAELAKRTKMSPASIERALATEGEIVMTIAHEAAFRRAFAVAGIELIEGDGAGFSVRLNKGRLA